MPGRANVEEHSAIVNTRGSTIPPPGSGSAHIAEREEKTTACSVATLRSLVARSAEDGPPPEVRPLSPSKPAFLEKSGAVLVMPEPPAAAPAVLNPSPPVTTSEAVSSSRPRLVPQERKHAHRARRREADRSLWKYIRCRLWALGLLVVVVASQPWWWNIGDLRSHGAPRGSREGRVAADALMKVVP
jgi:hypothetical protein